MHALGMRASNVWNLLAMGAFLSMNVSFLLHGTFVIDTSHTMGSLHHECTGSNRSKVETGANTTTTTTSACLYIMDDNHYLIGR